jgi:hypothetical protein
MSVKKINYPGTGPRLSLGTTRVTSMSRLKGIIVKCKDGFQVSVQASRGHYCVPKSDTGPWTHVEAGYPSQEEELLMPYIESGAADPTSSVYPYVPMEIINQIAEKHGGVV